MYWLSFIFLRSLVMIKSFEESTGTCIIYVLLILWIMCVSFINTSILKRSKNLSTF